MWRKQDQAWYIVEHLPHFKFGLLPILMQNYDLKANKILYTRKLILLINFVYSFKKFLKWARHIPCRILTKLCINVYSDNYLVGWYPSLLLASTLPLWWIWHPLRGVPNWPWWALLTQGTVGWNENFVSMRFYEFFHIKYIIKLH